MIQDLVVIETTDHYNFHVGLFFRPTHHFIIHKLIQNSPFFWITLYLALNIYVAIQVSDFRIHTLQKICLLTIIPCPYFRCWILISGNILCTNLSPFYITLFWFLNSYFAEMLPPYYIVLPWFQGIWSWY